MAVARQLTVSAVTIDAHVARLAASNRRRVLRQVKVPDAAGTGMQKNAVNQVRGERLTGSLS